MFAFAGPAYLVSAASTATTGDACTPAGDRQVVLVLQGGGALGAYQAGVYQGLHEAGIEPDWVIGTSIGAINAALGALGIGLKAGDVILSGSQSPLVPVKPGDSLHASVGGLGSTSVRFM